MEQSTAICLGGVEDQALQQKKPGQEFLQMMNSEITTFPSTNLNHFSITHQDSEGIELLTRFLQYESKKRISAEDAMKHAYFRSLGTKMHSLPENISIFSLKDIQLQKDPGFRNSSYPETGTLLD
ncbi:hypothetical protein AB205_0177810 [Aquarana catesbeiana]|uniref:Protein kinase domain-containing protein n=1 Tax=Aquarana catesbeiana TaxID=8400 RepID=A0A2G9S9Z1_AQUCT|nr:hypothetical protein AB205_0177810 [Aquarana catesbeiana]